MLRLRRKNLRSRSNAENRDLFSRVSPAEAAQEIRIIYSSFEFIHRDEVMHKVALFPGFFCAEQILIRLFSMEITDQNAWRRNGNMSRHTS
jgi:hypothetical protein